MRLFHRTSEAAAILRDGFRDGRGKYGFERELRGVWLSAEGPLSEGEGAFGSQVLEADLPDDLVVSAGFEVVEPDKCIREFIIPAAILNDHRPFRLVPAGEVADLEEALCDARLRRAGLALPDWSR